MGRAINVDNKIDAMDRRLKLVEDALEEMVQTRVHHIDLTDDINIKAEGVQVKPDEEFTPPIGRRKKTTRKKTATVD